MCGLLPLLVFLYQQANEVGQQHFGLVLGRFLLRLVINHVFGFGKNNLFRLTECFCIFTFRFDGGFRHKIQFKELVFVPAVNRAVYKKGLTTVHKSSSSQLERTFVYF